MKPNDSRFVRRSELIPGQVEHSRLPLACPSATLAGAVYASTSGAQGQQRQERRRPIRIMPLVMVSNIRHFQLHDPSLETKCNRLVVELVMTQSAGNPPRDR